MTFGKDLQSTSFVKIGAVKGILYGHKLNGAYMFYIFIYIV